MFILLNSFFFLFENQDFICQSLAKKVEMFGKDIFGIVLGVLAARMRRCS